MFIINWIRDKFVVVKNFVIDTVRAIKVAIRSGLISFAARFPRTAVALGYVVEMIDRVSAFWGNAAIALIIAGYVGKVVRIAAVPVIAAAVIGVLAAVEAVALAVLAFAIGYALIEPLVHFCWPVIDYVLERSQAAGRKVSAFFQRITGRNESPIVVPSMVA